MAGSVHDDMTEYVGFDRNDADNLRAVAGRIAPHLAEIVDRFYQTILQHPGTRSVLSDGTEQLARLRQTLTAWLDTLFCGEYGQAYWQRRSEIGRTHVRVGLPQHFMFAAMELVWHELSVLIRRVDVSDANGKLRSLHKLLTIETAVMLESYKESYSHEVRRAEREAMRERLAQAEHLAQTGQLAASLAHEIKNPLAGISGAIQVIRESIPPDNPHRPILAEILRQINRLDGTVKDLLIYARPKPPRFKRCKLDRIIERTLASLRREPEVQRVRLETVNNQAITLYADEVQLEQLLVNLLLNAAQASQAGDLIRIAASSEAEGFQLTVEDHGHGMDRELCRRAFEPFFTSKARGTGLGLSICRKIVDAHGGIISLQSAPGEGTTATVRLPCYPPATTSEHTDEDPRPDR